MEIKGLTLYHEALDSRGDYEALLNHHWGFCLATVLASKSFIIIVIIIIVNLAVCVWHIAVWGGGFSVVCLLILAEIYDSMIVGRVFLYLILGQHLSWGDCFLGWERVRVTDGEFLSFFSPFCFFLILLYGLSLREV